MNALPFIEAKRDGGTLEASSIRALVEAQARGQIPDYQMAALLMAIYFRGLNPAETRALTAAMRDSGEVLAFPKDSSRPVVDKHSTGGIGDKVSLPLAPLLACLGFRVPMISGRGLGITGGTLDKLESIPGFRTRFQAREMIDLVERVGCVICGQSETMCPADRRLYALRDVTGTVPSIPLITGSILSKKLAEGLEALVLDVKFGQAAFMRTQEQARALADSMTAIANESGVKTRALLTDMNHPIGRAAGNWLEVKESVACLENRGPADLRELVIACAAHLLTLTGRCLNLAAGRQRADEMLASGAPREKWDEMLLAQGANLSAFESLLLKDSTAPQVVALPAPKSGFVAEANARIIGEIIRDLGGGRMTQEATIAHEVGLDGLVAVGERVEAGQPLCRLHLRADAQPDTILERLLGAFTLSPVPVTVPPRVVEVV